MSMGRGFSIRRLRTFDGTAKPRLEADLIAITPITRPRSSTRGLPLLPGSIGIATWIMGRPSSSLSSAITPLATLWLRPRGLPMVRTPCPVRIMLESPSSRPPGALPSTRMTTRSASRSTAMTSLGSSVFPSGRVMVKGLPSPMTWKFVTRYPRGPMKKPLPTPEASPFLPDEVMAVTAWRVFRMSSSSVF